MIKRTTYKGTIDGKFIIACDTIPEGMVANEIIEYFQPDNGKVFCKDGEFFNILIVTKDLNIEEYNEVDIPEEIE